MSYYLERIQRGVDFIESKLDEDVVLSAVAREAGLSQWHFQRIFKALTGETLKTYIRSRRLAASLERLLTTNLRVLDIALLAGFESQEAFARAFKASFGISPLSYRKLGKRSLFLRKPQFDSGYLAQLQKNPSLEPTFIEEPARVLVGVRTTFFGTGSEKNNFSARLPALWAEFTPHMHEIPARDDTAAYGVVRQCSEADEELEYHAACIVSSLGAIPGGMRVLELPRTRYARFSHRGPAEELDRTVSYAYATWLAGSGLRHSGGADLEIYGAEYHPTSPDSLIEYAIPLAD